MTMGHTTSVRSPRYSIQFCTSLVVLTLAALIGVPSSDAAASDDWFGAVIRESRTAEADVRRGRSRLASLSRDASNPQERSSRPGASSRDDDDSSSRRRARDVRVASRGDRRSDEDRPRRSLSGGGGSVNWLASAGCLDGTLRSIVHSLASNFGAITVNSTCRSRGHNASVGGAPRSKHLTGDAVDFRVHSNVSAVYASLRGNGNVGGLKHYGGGLFHIDNGERRSW